MFNMYVLTIEAQRKLEYYFNQHYRT